VEYVCYLLASLVLALDRVTQRVLYYKRLHNAFPVVDYPGEENTMPQKPLPVVSDHLLHMLDSEANERTPVVVGSERWYTWLAEEQNRSFSFRNALGTFTVRCERKRHGWYWYIYRKSGGKLRKAYLGKAEEVTLERLGTVAATLLDQPTSDDDLHEYAPVNVKLARRGYVTPAKINTHNLPVPLTPLIGRKPEVTTACALLRRTQVRLLVLTGPGGIGKTRMALQIATDLQQDFPAGVCFVSLEPLRDPALVAPTIANALGLRETATTSVVDQLKGSLSAQHLLLLLDNFEQVAAAASLLTELLAACPKLKVLVSSRTRLHVRGEHEFVVPPLAMPDPKQIASNGSLLQYAAVALFLQCAWAFQPEFQVTSNSTRDIAEICVRLEGVPLAIELAAARIKHLPPQALLAQLEHRLPLLTNGPQDVPARQQTLRNTLAWSYSLLNSWEQQLLRQLSVFVGGCTLQAAEAVCRAIGDDVGARLVSVLDGVASLIDKSLLYQTEQQGEEPHFGMLEMTREYGREMLALCEETEAARQAHALYYLALVEQAAQAWEGPQHAVWSGRLERDHDNLRAAMQWALEQGKSQDHLEIAYRFGAALRSFWQVRGYFREGRTFLEEVIARSEKSLPSLHAKALNDAVLLAVSQADHAWGEALCYENLVRCRELGDRAAVARTLYLLGWLALLQGNFATAHSRLSESLALYQEVGDKGGSLVSLFWLGVVITNQGEYTRACALFEQTQAMQRELGNKRGIAWSLFHLAWVRSLSPCDLNPVYSLLTEAGALFKEIGDIWGMAECYQLLGRLTLQQGDVVTAQTLLEQSLTLFREIGNRRGIARSFSQLGDVAAMQQDWARARMLYEESLIEAQAASDKVEIASCLERVAGVVIAGGASLATVLWAAQLWGAAEASRERMGAPLPPVERATYKERVAAARNSIGKRIFSAYWAQGRTMTPAQALVAQGKAATPSQISTEPALISTRSRAANLAGLTAREVEVLHWVALGLTDAQVAEQLVISPRTVTSHLSSIYNKLGVSSRAAATRFAMEHQLV
jgi:predicted ATPase/DNA-binding CsgD family transcriptional regulator